MDESKALVTNRWSSLNTVDEFDNGFSSSDKEILTTSKEISQTIAKSLFVESLIDQLCKLLEKDPIKKNKLYERICSKLYKMHLIEDTYCIEELASLRTHFQQALLDIMIAPDARLCSLPNIKSGNSRYATEYEEICFLASGGFGHVFKARNRLDQVTYAVKKISLKYKNMQSIALKLNEVKTIAKLNHPNIVQYKGAWLEPVFNFKQAITSSEVKNLSSTDSDVVVFQSNQTLSDNNQGFEIENEQENMAICKYQRGERVSRPVPQVCALLYVSMQLCDETLYEWLHKRNSHSHLVDVPLVLNIITQATAGVQYIHSCNIVHHDIKPRNIFLSHDLKSVQVGDFGLSCCLLGHDHSDCPLEGGQFGTPLYAAPEQLNGRCDPKSDIFSLGLVLIELLTVFSTEMERVKILTKVRSGYLPPSIPPTFVTVIKDLLSRKSSNRPTASELLNKLEKLKLTEFCESKEQPVISKENDAIPELDAEEEKCDVLKKKEKEILHLRQILAQREIEIEQLKYFINKSSS